ncbi:unnamed protein product [Peronospora belbahrii]|uniref:Uncharacterized protein n=1 Tax=Peronospora belbahrii TaxID=622444 RepID=A0AAU9L3W6_9STRA|nr:unnamed protein product [Peronospora belbahrii]
MSIDTITNPDQALGPPSSRYRDVRASYSSSKKASSFIAHLRSSNTSANKTIWPPTVCNEVSRQVHREGFVLHTAQTHDRLRKLNVEAIF